MLPTVWFIVLSFMLAGYAVLDGFDLGVGALHLFTGAERARSARWRSTPSARCGTATRCG